MPLLIFPLFAPVKTNSNIKRFTALEVKIAVDKRCMTLYTMSRMDVVNLHRVCEVII
jgi:hypothetical protein